MGLLVMRILGLIAFRGWIAPRWLAVPARTLALTLLASLILFPTPLSAQSITFSKGAANTTKMQKALYYLGCYGGAYDSVGDAADGDFGGTTSNSNQALKLLDDTADAKLRGLIDSAENSSASIPALLDYLAGYLSEWKAGDADEDYCGEDNDLPTLSATALYDEVHSGRKAGALACSASTITSSYLEKFKDDTKLKSVRDLDAPLKTLIDKYPDVFDPTIAHDKEVHDDNVERLEAVATIGKSRTETLELLKDARKALLALIARYGANDEPCGSCFAINDYKLLKSRAQAKFLGDTLYYSKNPTKVKVDVKKIKRAWMYDIRDNMLIYRRITDDWLASVNGGGKKRPADALKPDELEEERQMEMDTIIRRLSQLQKIDTLTTNQRDQFFRDFPTIARPEVVPAHIKNGDTLMSQLDETYSCDGFTGKTVKF